MAQSRATKSRAKSRKKPSAGGSGVETSTAPRWKSPAAVLAAKAPANVSATLGSSDGASGSSTRRSRPEGETASVSRRSIEGLHVVSAGTAMRRDPLLPGDHAVEVTEDEGLRGHVTKG